MSRLTKCNKNRIECNIGHCPKDCNTCGMFNDIRKKLSYYEDLEEQGKLIEVVRCKNCIRHNTSIMVIGFGWCDVWNQVTHDDGYCSRAEAKLEELKEGVK